MNNGFYVKKCSCGAVTVDFEGESISMPEELFNKHFPMLEIEPEEWGICNHCVNHWGIDICGCGSGEPVGKCENYFSECRSKEPGQSIDKLNEFKAIGNLLWTS